MDSLNLPMHLAQFADWEYPELTIDGATVRVGVTKSGIIPVVTTGGAVQLSDPTRAGVNVYVVVASKTTGGSFGVTSATGNIYYQEQSFGVSYTAQFYLPNASGVWAHFVSMPIYIAGVRTYRWFCTTIPA